jgi:hypothetical protein
VDGGVILYSVVWEDPFDNVTFKQELWEKSKSRKELKLQIQIWRESAYKYS